jgi:hypothetical protein
MATSIAELERRASAGTPKFGGGIVAAMRTAEQDDSARGASEEMLAFLVNFVQTEQVRPDTNVAFCMLPRLWIQ